MSASPSSPMPAVPARQVSLIEAAAWALAVNLLVYLVLPLIGLTGLLLADVPQPAEERELRFTFAKETETGKDTAPTSVDDQGSEPGTPEIGPPLPDPEDSASLDRPQPAVPPSLPMPATLPLPGDAASDNPAPEPPSDGVEEGLKDGAETTSEPLSDDPASDTETTEQVNTDGVALDEEARGRFARLQQPPANAPPPRIGRPTGPSIDERISAFERAVKRFRERTPATPGQQPRNVFQPDWSNLPPTGQTVGNLMFESVDFEWSDYGRQIYWIIWRAWHNRLLARVDDFEKWAQLSRTPMLDHVNGVQFTIESNGQISGIVLEMDSGSVPFDLSSVEALDESLLPPLPEGFPRDSETVHVQFIGYGPIGSMRRGLLEYKRRGWF